MKLLQFLLRRSPALVLLAVFAGAVSGAASTGLLAVVHRSLQDPSASGDRNLLLAFLGLCAVVPVARVVSNYLLSRLGQETVRRLWVELVERILATPLPRLEELGSHRLLAALTNDVAAISVGVIQIPALAVAVSIVAGCLAYLAYLSAPLLAVFLVVMAVGVISYQLPIIAGMARLRRARDRQDRLFDHFRSLTGGIQELKLHHQRQHAFTRAVDATARFMERSYVSALTIFSAAASWGHLLFFVVIGVLIFGLASLRFFDHGALLGYTLTVLYMMHPLQASLDVLPQLGRASVSLAKVEQLGLSLAQSTLESGATVSAPPSWDSLELRDVCYRYPAVAGEEGFGLGPISLTLRPGELVFLVGGNGCGKTTLAKVLAGLYGLDSGEIRLDDRPVGEGELGWEAYRQLFSVIFAQPHLFDELLGLDRPDLDAEARGYLAELELADKLKVEEGRLSTVALSEGQKKRLALVTAFLEDRPFYVFDEWAANQDAVFRKAFYESILPKLKARGKTVLVISHDERYYSVADRLVKLDLGKVAYDGDLASSPYASRVASVDATPGPVPAGG